MRQRRDRRDIEQREPESMTVAFEAIERAQRAADSGFRRVLELLNEPRDQSQDGTVHADVDRGARFGTMAGR